MSELAKKSREANKNKAKRLSSEKYERVDSSDWTPAEPLNGDVKTGMRPISRRAFKKGGKVHGECGPVRLDRKPRKSGGSVKNDKNDSYPLVDKFINRDLKKANEYREGIKHVGGMKKGGRVGKNDGGGMAKSSPIETTAIERIKYNAGIMPKSTQKNADTGMSDEARKSMDKLIQRELGKKYGGCTKKADGGPVDPRFTIVKDRMLQFGNNAVVPGLKRGGKAEKHEDVAADKALIKKMVKAASLREKRATGGQVKGKGKTNISITVMAGKPDMGAMPMQQPAMPPKAAGVPVPVPPAGQPPVAMPPMANAPSPLPQQPVLRKSGGRVARKAGGGVYRSYKDMDAGSGSGFGRLEKTEIQSRKK